ncbi:MAG: hypothetical protein ACKVOW_16935, partial [Chitinophagaceae bacterium]
MFYYINPVIITFTTLSLLFFLRKYICRFLIWLLSQFISLPQGYSQKLLPAFVRVVYLNWYTFLMIFLIWMLLFLTEVGKDVLVMFIENLKIFNYGQRLGAYLSLFTCTFLISVSIWIIPFFLYSVKRRDDILENENYEKYYMATKMLAFFAM